MKVVLNGVIAALFFVKHFIKSQWKAIVELLSPISPQVFVIAAVAGALLAVFADEYSFALLILGAGGLSWFSFWMARWLE